MDKKMADALATKYGLKADGYTVFHGQPKGIRTVLYFYDRNKFFHIKFAATKKSSTVYSESLLQELRDLAKVTQVQENEHFIEVKGKTSLRTSSTLETLEAILDKLLPFLEKEEYSSGSFDSGVDDGTVKLTEIDQEYYYLSQADFRARTRVLDEKKGSIEDTQENYLLGLLGAIVGAALGGTLWLLVGHLGYIVWIAGFLTIFLGFQGYKLLGKKVGVVGVVLVFVLSILAIVVAHFGVWIWEFYNAARGFDPSYKLLDAIKITPEIIFSDKELLKPFLTDLLLGVGVMIIGGFFFIRDLYQKAAGQYKTKRWD